MKKFYVTVLVFLISYCSIGQVAPTAYNINKTFTLGNIGAYIQFGNITNTGLGTYAKFRVTTHNCGQLFITEYEFYGNYYAGSGTGWIEVPARNGNDWNGTQNMALDVRFANNNGNFELRLRRLSGGCDGASYGLQIYIETNSTFNAFDYQSTETAMPAGYLGSTAGWKFPVTTDRFQGSTNGMFISNNGNVGIGTTSPGYALDMASSTGSTVLNLRSNDNNYRPAIRFEAVRPTAGGIAFNMLDGYIGNVPTFLTHAGTVGVFGSVNTNPTPSTVNYMYFGTEATTDYQNNTFRLYPNKSAYFDGNVGIGTTNPQSALTVGNLNSGAGEATYKGTIQIQSSGGDINSTGGLEFKAASVAGGWGWRIASPDYGAANTPMVFHYRKGSPNWSEAMRIDNNGNLGIGASPAARFHVNAGLDRNLLVRSAGDLIGVAGIAIQSVNNANSLHLPLEIESSVLILNAGTAGSVGIGTTDPKGYKLAVNGSAIFTKVQVKATSNPFPDYVFKKEYKLPSLADVEAYINEFSHLPEVPSATEVEKDGLDVGATQAVLLKKIEELTLYVIQQAKEIEKLKEKVSNK